MTPRYTCRCGMALVGDFEMSRHKCPTHQMKSDSVEPKVRTVEEVAELIIAAKDLPKGATGYGLKLEIVQILTTFSDERVKAQFNGDKEHYEERIKQAVKEALLKHCECESWSAYKLIDKACADGFAEGRKQGAFECRHAKEIALEEAAKVADSGDCLQKCDSYGHEELCPVVHPGNAIRALKDKK